MRVSIRAFKANLFEYPRRAQRGEEVVVISRGKEVARLLGPRPARESEVDAVARLRAHSWITPASSGRLKGMESPVAVPSGTADEIMRWVRVE